RFFSKNPKIQDILVVRRQNVELAKKEKKAVKGFGFCCQASNGGPGTSDTFSLGVMAPESWIEPAHFVSDNWESLPVGAIQSAVWCLSDDHHLSSIQSTDKDIAELRNVIARAKGVEVPWYSTI